MWNIEKIVKKGDYLYAVVRNHPRATKHGYVLLHRIVVENHLNRLLDADEVVHHRDRNRFNNAVENLEVMSKQAHARLHNAEKLRTVVRLKCPWCKQEFVRIKSQTHLSKPGQRYTCCFPSCRGRLSRSVQLGQTHKLDSAISENVLSITKENSEQTATTGCVETIRRAPETVKK